MSQRVTDVRRRRGLPLRLLGGRRPWGGGAWAVSGSRAQEGGVAAPPPRCFFRALVGRYGRTRGAPAGRGAREPAAVPDEGGAPGAALRREAPERSGSPFFFVHAVDVNQMRHAGVTAPSCVIRERLDCSPSHVFLRRFRPNSRDLAINPA